MRKAKFLSYTWRNPIKRRRDTTYREVGRSKRTKAKEKERNRVKDEKGKRMVVVVTAVAVPVAAALKGKRVSPVERRLGCTLRNGESWIEKGKITF